MKNQLEHLEWDSSFFGYPVAKIIIHEFNPLKVEEFIKQAMKEQVKLVYFFCPPLSIKNHQHMLSRGFTFVDEKLTYSKKTEKHREQPFTVIQYNGPVTDQLISLSLQSGAYSRFATDPNFPNHEYERLYTEWIKRSVNSENAIQTLVIKKDKLLAGLVTIEEKNGEANIGLLAVDKKFREKNFGAGLTRAADSFAFNKGFKKINVVTQKQNLPACGLYKKMNFALADSTFVYHFWNHEQ
ncbi:MAG: GNAT family N-acetyltransferase [Prolixibacteraceae bacterium]|nr:GNAT family N-acetyltransferase [Prolixibacteraceae bacterium]